MEEAGAAPCFVSSRPALAPTRSPPPLPLATPHPHTHTAGYWAFGNAVTPYLPASFVGPAWAVRMSEFFALLQIVGCYQVGGAAWGRCGGRCGGRRRVGGEERGRGSCSQVLPSAWVLTCLRPHSIRHPSACQPVTQIYCRPTYEAVELKVMDTKQVRAAASSGGGGSCQQGRLPALLPLRAAGLGGHLPTLLASSAGALRAQESLPPGLATPPTRLLCAVEQGPMAPRNVVTRFAITTVYVAVLTLIGCALPFFGDFLALVRAGGTAAAGGPKAWREPAGPRLLPCAGRPPLRVPSAR